MDQSARPAGLREAGLLLSPRDASLMAHAVGPGELAAPAPLLLPLRRAHRDRGGRPHPPLPGVRRRALPAHRPRRDHAGHRRAGPGAARPPGALARGPFLDPGGVRGAGRVHRAVGAPRGVRGGGRHGRPGRVRGEPALAVPVQPDARLHGQGHVVEITVDGEEIHEARWFSREDLAAAFESGEVLPPYGISIAARLIELWYGQPAAEADALTRIRRAVSRSILRKAPVRGRDGGLRGSAALSGARQTPIFCLTCASDGLVSVEPSSNEDGRDRLVAAVGLLHERRPTPGRARC